MFEEGNAARLAGDYDKARGLLEEALVACPDSADCHWSLGHVLINVGEFDDGIASFRKAVELEPENQRIAVDLAKSLEMLGEFDEAKPVLERVIEINPNSREAEEARKSLSYY